MPKRKSNEIITGDTGLLPDRWLYHWSGDPPRDFCLGKTLFSMRTPADIATNDWHVLLPTVAELTRALGLRSIATRIDWLSLDSVYERRCQIGVYGDRIVVAADAVGAARKPFIPYRYFEAMARNPNWKDTNYSCSYRHFVARFHTGLTFRADRLGLLCDVEYSLHFGIRGIHSLGSTLRIGGTLIAVPTRIRVAESLDDLPGKVERLAHLGQSFVARLGASWLPVMDEVTFWEYVTTLLQSLSVPASKRNELRRDKELTRCLTKLDLLLFLSRHLQSGPTFSASDMLILSQRLATIQCHDQHTQSSRPFPKTVRSTR